MTPFASAFASAFARSNPAHGAVYPDPSDVRLGVAYGPTGTEYTGTMTGGAGLSAADIAAAVVSALQGTTIPVDAVQGAWPTAAQNADATWGYAKP